MATYLKRVIVTPAVYPHFLPRAAPRQALYLKRVTVTPAVYPRFFPSAESPVNSPGPRPVASPASTTRRPSWEGAGEGLGDSVNSPSPRPVASPASPKRRPSGEGAGEGLGDSMNSPSPRPVASAAFPKRRPSREGTGRGLGEFVEAHACPFPAPSLLPLAGRRDRPRARKKHRESPLALRCKFWRLRLARPLALIFAPNGLGSPSDLGRSPGRTAFSSRRVSPARLGSEI